MKKHITLILIAFFNVHPAAKRPVNPPVYVRPPAYGLPPAYSSYTAKKSDPSASEQRQLVLIQPVASMNFNQRTVSQILIELFCCKKAKNDRTSAV